MAKGTITPSAIAVNNIQALDDVVVGQAGSLKALFDKGDSDQQTYINTVLIPELNGNDGSKKIGHNSVNIAADNVNEAIEEVYAAIASTALGEIPNNSITDAKLATDNKVGSLATLGTTEKSSVVGAINELEGEVDTLITDVGNLTTSASTNTTNLEILRKFNPTTGSNVALAVDTFGTFDLTKNGNILNIIPNVTNTGAMTINPDSQGAKSIKKFNVDTDAYIDIEASDIKKNTPTSLAWILASDFFVLAPKSGANPLKEWKNTTGIVNPLIANQTLVSRLSVSGSGWIVLIANKNTTTNHYALKVDGNYVVGSVTQGASIGGTAPKQHNLMIRYTSSFEIFDTGNAYYVYYLEGNEYELSTPKESPITAVTENFTILSVVGSGWINSILWGTTGDLAKVTIDGTYVKTHAGDSLTGELMLTRFKNSLVVKSQLANNRVGISYTEV